MPVAALDDVEISYLDEGAGEPVLLIHGFASTKEVNWVETGWVRALVESGKRVIAFDNRGHGQSTKFHEARFYSLQAMALDAFRLIDYLQIERPHVMGYSMGARITARLACDHGPRLGRLILAGNGYSMVEGTGDWTDVRDALLAPSLADVEGRRGRAFRAFADQTRSDRVALAECVTAVRQTFSEDEFRRIRNPVLVAIGTEDDVAGSGEKLAALMANARYLPIPGRDHMRAVGDMVYRRGVLEFLAE